ncbi:hypothetical protein HDU96_004963, partial [Phlyctochytrium bullatum]
AGKRRFERGSSSSSGGGNGYDRGGSSSGGGNPFSGAQRSASPGRQYGPCFLCKEEHNLRACPKLPMIEEIWSLWESGHLDQGSLPTHLKSAAVFKT